MTHKEKRRELLIEICNVLTVVSASHKKVVDAIHREDFWKLCKEINKLGRRLIWRLIFVVNFKDFAANYHLAAIDFDGVRI